MLSIRQKKFVRSLHLKKNRNTQQRFIAEGVKVVKELLDSDFSIETVFGTASFIAQYSAFPEYTEWVEVTPEELKNISTLSTANEVLAIARYRIAPDDKAKYKGDLTLMLDTIQDPGNMGAIIRTADWFGIHNLICSTNNVDIYNPKVVQASMGSVFRVQVLYTDLAQFLKKNSEKNIPVYGALLNETSIYNQPLNKKAIILIGNESKGIAKELLPFITHPVNIPSYPDKGDTAESLNAATATAIICAEFRRRQADSLR